MKIIILIVVCVLRLFLAFSNYNPDIHNHQAWVASIKENGWSGLYTRDVSPWASVNYPPIALYSFVIGDKLYQSLPISLQSSNTHAFFYKLPSILADLLIAYLLYRFAPYSSQVKSVLAILFLLSPALLSNSVLWGQIESFAMLFAIAMLIALVRGRSDLAILSFTLGVLIKQTILPLAPLLLYGLYSSKLKFSRLLSISIICTGLFLLSYTPFLTTSDNFLTAPQLYLSSLAGQPHQHEASSNALNIWYAIGLNHFSDSSVRPLSLLITAALSIIGIIHLHQSRQSLFYRYFYAATLIFLGTFIFTTRMHERHGYMAIATLTFLLGEGSCSRLYLVMSMISAYNLYGVWAELFAAPPSDLWSIAMVGLAIISTLTFPWLLLLHYRQNQSDHNRNDDHYGRATNRNHTER